MVFRPKPNLRSPVFSSARGSALILRDTIRAVGIMRETNRNLQLTCEKVVKNGVFVHREVQKTAIGGFFDTRFQLCPRIGFASRLRHRSARRMSGTSIAFKPVYGPSGPIGRAVRHSRFLMFKVIGHPTFDPAPFRRMAT